MSSVQDGSVARNPTFYLPPTTKRGITANLKTKTKKEQPEIQTTWESKNPEVKETFIQIGRGAEMDSQRREDMRQGSGWAVAGGSVSPTFAPISWKGPLGSETDLGGEITGDE